LIFATPLFDFRQIFSAAAILSPRFSRAIFSIDNASD